MEKKQKKVRVRGTGCYDPETQGFAFEPFNEGAPTQKDVKKCAGGGKRWTTTGADPSKMITLKTKENAADPYADFVRQFNALTRDLKPKKPVQMPDSQRVVCEDGLECWLSAENGELRITGTVSLARHPRDWQAEVLRHVQLAVRRLPASETFNHTVKKFLK